MHKEDSKSKVVKYWMLTVIALLEFWISHSVLCFEHKVLADETVLGGLGTTGTPKIMCASSFYLDLCFFLCCCCCLFFFHTIHLRHRFSRSAPLNSPLCFSWSLKIKPSRCISTIMVGLTFWNCKLREILIFLKLLFWVLCYTKDSNT